MENILKHVLLQLTKWVFQVSGWVPSITVTLSYNIAIVLNVGADVCWGIYTRMYFNNLTILFHPMTLND